MKTNRAASRSTLSLRARAIATADDCLSVAPSHVIRAALEAGHGTIARPLSAVLPGQRVTGLRPSRAAWAASVEAMLQGGWLYAGTGGRLTWAGRRAA